MATLRETLEATCNLNGLTVLGVVPQDSQNKALVGLLPEGWGLFKSSAEYRDGAENPLDRWSKRILGDIARQMQASDVRYPFEGPPYEPFIKWAFDSKETFSSPVGMLVHHRAGFWISFRGALVFGPVLESVKAENPCPACDQPCKTACPVDALSADTGYDVATCHAFLDTPAGLDCMENGCKARRACPVSQRFGRDPAQSAFHMRSFHPT